ncbi:SET domain-containing protein 4 [Geranomyces michiganensis]|nr:SET domain-containing protein 4 [Geranomyces michiganensis]
MVEGLLAWLAARGYAQDLLELAEFPRTGRGMRAMRDIKAGETLVRIPESVLLTSRTPAVGSVCARVCGTKVLTEHQKLALFLAVEKSDPESAFAPYIAVLPASFGTVAGGARAGPVVNAMPSRMRELCHAVWARCDVDFEAISSANIDRKVFEWAWFAVNTRCVSLNSPTTEPGNPTIALAPLLDFLNHSPSVSTIAAFDPTSRTFALTTVNAIAKGEQAFISYGPHDNAFLAAEYGFAVPGNGANVCHVDAEFEHVTLDGETTAARDASASACLGLGLTSDFALYADGEISPRLLAALRIRVQAASLPGHQLPPDISIICWDELPEHQERIVHDAVKKICKQIISAGELAIAGLVAGEDDTAAELVREVWRGEVAIALRHAQPDSRTL